MPREQTVFDQNSRRFTGFIPLQACHLPAQAADMAYLPTQIYLVIIVCCMLYLLVADEWYWLAAEEDEHRIADGTGACRAACLKLLTRAIRPHCWRRILMMVITWPHEGGHDSACRMYHTPDHVAWAYPPHLEWRFRPPAMMDSKWLGRWCT